MDIIILHILWWIPSINVNDAMKVFLFFITITAQTSHGLSTYTLRIIKEKEKKKMSKIIYDSFLGVIR